MWIAIPTDLAFTPLGQRLQRDFGPEGIALWVALLCAAKRSLNEGTVTFYDDTPWWRELRLSQPSTSDLIPFLDCLASMKEAHRKRHGAALEVTLTRYTEMQKPRGSGGQASHKGRSRAGNVARLSHDSAESSHECEQVMRPDRDMTMTRTLTRRESAEREPFIISEAEKQRQIDGLIRLGGGER
jgi:hypothetical protein